MVRVIVGAAIAGIVVFFWGAISHMALPIGTMGLRNLPNEDAVMTAAGSDIQPGFYVFPSFDMTRTASEAEEQAWTEKYRKGPAGILVIRPRGGEPMSPGQLLTELASNVAAALVAGLVLTQVRLGYAARVGLVASMGLFGLLSVVVSYWNWYGFPDTFLAAEAIDQLVGWTLGGLALAAVVRPTSLPKASSLEG